MSDEPKPAPEVTFTPDRDTPGSLEDEFAKPEVKALLDRAAEPKSPVVITDEMWGGPRWIHDATREPVFVRTKEEYFALLKREGLHMENQQESDPAPDVERAAPPIPVFATPHPPVRPLTQYEAEVFGAITAVFKRYGLKESLWCEHCFARNAQPHNGCRMIVNPRRVAFQCRGGVAEWSTPVGETNLVLDTIANSAVTEADIVPGTITTADGTTNVPARLLQPQEAVIIREYIRILRARGIEPRWHHDGCWSGNAFNEDDAMAMAISDTQIIVICKCFQLFDRSVRAGSSEVVN